MKINLAGVQINSGYKAQEQELLELKAKIEAIDKSQAMIEFNLDGTIITANNNFLNAMGYTLDEIVGKHHSMFVDDELRASNEYLQFWDKLNRGEFVSGEFKRVDSVGHEVWIQASYNPILDDSGRPYKVVKFASDITASKQQTADYRGQIEAIGKSQAVIEFDMDGTIRHANDNFLGAMGYTLDEIKGKHHSMFASPEYAASDEYREFWATLNRGEFFAGEFQRLGKGGKEVWIQASYNPILDASGRPFKVVKYASDITAQKIQAADHEGQIAAIGKSQAVIEFEMDGTIRHANENFLGAMGYTLSEVQGKHHSMFADEETANSQEYRDFWAKLNRGEYEAGEFKRFGKGGKEIWIQASYNPILDANGKPFKVVKYASDITAQKQQEAESRKLADLSSALKLCNANVMLADNDLNITYMNNGMLRMMRNHQTEIRKVLPKFDAETLLGSCADIFHQNVAHQRGIVSSLEKTDVSRIKVAGLTFRLTMSPWTDPNGVRLGTVVEWHDLTEELAAKEKEEAVAQANARVKIALDKCQANVMLADNDLNIIYTNDSVLSMLKGNEAKLRSALPNFNADKLIGTCVDDFHVNPAHQRSLLASLTKPYETKLRISDLTFELVASPIFDEDGSRLGTVVEWGDITAELAAREEEKALAAANARIKQALDCVSTNTMIADADNTIIYMNTAIEHMMADAESDIKAVLPNFDAHNLIGQNMDAFHQNPAHQKGVIKRLEDAYQTEINVGVRTFSLTANPIVSESDERIGTVVEWNDRTGEVAIEKEIANLISAAGEGDLTNRIEEDGKSGFFLNLAGGLNQLVGIAEGVINETAQMLDAMAHGDLSKRIETDYQGAFDKLKSDANGTAEKLTEVISRINNSASAVASGAEEIAQGNTDLSQRTEEQASSLEETASSMEQMTSTVKQNADNAKVANDLAADATTKAQKGGDVVKRAVDSMSEINESSKKIADIIGVIDEIAFQTNLLALNAAVEAARAGEQGRGFAVVAGEVRNLAQRSAAAAKEIKDLIRDSVAKVQDGSQLVNESGATLNEIVEAISRVTAMIADISNASSEQSEGIEQVNKAVTQMDEMTQQNAALVEQASAAGEAMADQARGMKQILGFFNAAGSGSGAGMLPAPPPEPVATAAEPVSHSAPAAPSAIGHSMDFADDDEEWEEF